MKALLSDQGEVPLKFTSTKKICDHRFYTQTFEIGKKAPSHQRTFKINRSPEGAFDLEIIFHCK